MKSIDLLEREHLWIGWMAESLEAIVGRAQSDGILPAEAYDLIMLYEVFADGRHQDKEEQVLFPSLLDAADEHERGLLERLLHDHETERSCMASMRSNVLGAVYGEPGCVREFVRDAREYLDLHHAHMMRESEIVFPLAERLFTAEDDRRCVEQFETIEGGADDPHGMREQILHLRQRIGLPRPPAA